MTDREETRIVARNRKAKFEYELSDHFEAGLVLVGSEVKSLREGKAQLEDAYAKLQNGEIWLIHAHIPEYEKATIETHDPKRARKLLLHRQQIRKLQTKLNERGFTLVPLALYFKGAYAKVEIALAKGKKRFDKRETMRASEDRREMQRASRRRR
ncbi:MAG TPA: SsrA-binding protein SmpB [Planctomycetota bacterium]|nr:SsrA-binding protein SmpB [Planctomycetota bacterium]